ncbi:MAG: WecB/TagA/CpsF family glycosyltransferase [Patescibacteria group bacterium]|jgi:N-acetylglucosaminyldiphosphoundecaprenol N-acetyl-beta-D-mannosaminyltransferase
MNILGIKIDNITCEKALEQIKGFFVDNKQHLIVTLNPEMVVEAQEDREFKKVLNYSDLTLIDGVGLVFALWFFGLRSPKRITGVDFTWKLIELAEKTDKIVYLLGGRNGVVDAAANVFKKRFPQAKIFFGGNSADPSDQRLITEINQARPQILFVAFGHGKQEKWIMNNFSKIPSVDVALGVGGTFDFISGRVARAPKIIRKLGLEWFWRLVRQPWRVGRIINATCKFSYLIVKSKISKGKNI